MVFDGQNDVAIFKIGYMEDHTGKFDERLEKCGITVHYETEPPRGDGIYSVILSGNQKLPFWIYDRDIILVGEDFMIVESVQYDTFEPISTVMIDIKKARYADFKEWYPDICVTKDGIELDNRFHKVKKMILKNTCDLEWIDLSTGIGTTK
ncbi:hypothetical protein [Filifactor alocis]|nr:hypothetical protein [Filifactor alocis]